MRRAIRCSAAVSSLPPIDQTPSAATWMSIQRAAAFLGLGAAALRRSLERHATPGRDGVTEAHVDGVHARKLGRLWRVRLSAAWLGDGAYPARVEEAPRATLSVTPKPTRRPERTPA